MNRKHITGGEAATARCLLNAAALLQLFNTRYQYILRRNPANTVTVCRVVAISDKHKPYPCRPCPSTIILLLAPFFFFQSSTALPTQPTPPVDFTAGPSAPGNPRRKTLGDGRKDHPSRLYSPALALKFAAPRLAPTAHSKKRRRAAVYGWSFRRFRTSCMCTDHLHSNINTRCLV